MNRAELAVRRYRDTITEELGAKAPAERFWRMPVRRIEAWITEYVLPAIEDVLPRTAFRAPATWPQRNLIVGAGTPERSAVEQVDRALIAEGSALRRLARQRRVAQRLLEMAEAAPPQPAVEAVRITGSDNPRIPGTRNLHAIIPVHLRQLEYFVTRPWTDLVCSDDYLGPVGGMMWKEPPVPHIADGAMVVSLNSHLFYVGDMITRCMLQRVRSWMSFLSEARALCYEAVRSVALLDGHLTAAERAAWSQLEAGFDDLQLRCLAGPEARLREACITLVQIYAEFHTAPDLVWLGTRRKSIERFRGVLRRDIISRRNLETLDRIAGALGELQLIYRNADPEVAPIDAAIAAGGLVLIERDRRMYWQGTLIDRDWQSRKCRNHWNMLWKLAINARTASAVGNYDLYTDAVANSTLHARASRLKRLLPPALREFIVPGTEQATYRLSLPATQIHLFPAARTASR